MDGYVKLADQPVVENCHACQRHRQKLPKMLLFSQPVSEMRDEIQKLDSRINGLVPKNVAVNKTVNLART